MGTDDGQVDDSRAGHLALQFVQSWRDSGLCPLPGATTADLVKFERTAGVRLPGVMCEYLLVANGTADDGSELNDERAIRLRSISEMEPIEDPGYEGCYVFADYLLGSHQYGVFLRGPLIETVVLVSDLEPYRVASCMEEFIQLYLGEPNALFDTSRPITSRGTDHRQK